MDAASSGKAPLSLGVDSQNADILRDPGARQSGTDHLTPGHIERK